MYSLSKYFIVSEKISELILCGVCIPKLYVTTAVKDKNLYCAKKVLMSSISIFLQMNLYVLECGIQNRHYLCKCWGQIICDILTGLSFK